MLDEKKWTDSERVAYEFRIKKISFIGVDDKILTEIHKFPSLFNKCSLKNIALLMDE